MVALPTEKSTPNLAIPDDTCWRLLTIICIVADAQHSADERGRDIRLDLAEEIALSLLIDVRRAELGIAPAGGAR